VVSHLTLTAAGGIASPELSDLSSGPARTWGRRCSLGVDAADDCMRAWHDCVVPMRAWNQRSVKHGRPSSAIPHVRADHWKKIDQLRRGKPRPR